MDQMGQIFSKGNVLVAKVDVVGLFIKNMKYILIIMCCLLTSCQFFQYDHEPTLYYEAEEISYKNKPSMPSLILLNDLAPRVKASVIEIKQFKRIKKLISRYQLKI